MGQLVTRHLNYAWIEYGDPRDGIAFTDGLFQMGWRNAMHGFPLKSDALGVRYVDASHPLLPIRWTGSGLLILPNEKIDMHGSNPALNDPIYVAYRNANGEEKFKKEIAERNEFIANWVFCPGIKKVSDAESHLTTGRDISDYVDMLGISGHGCAGGIWGGGAHAEVGAGLYTAPKPASDRLKYVIISTCYNVSWDNVDTWLPAFRRDYPLHGVLGYGDGYPGDEVGGAVFQRFMNNLKAGGGSTYTILEAWRNAHTGADSKIWAAMFHGSSVRDNMAKWLADKLEPPEKEGPVMWYDEKNPNGKVVVPLHYPFLVNFYTGDTMITAQNTHDSTIGLFPGRRGALRIAKKTGKFAPGEIFTITFFYFRPSKPGMNLDKLLRFDTPHPDGDMTLLTDHNKRDGEASKFVDAVQFAVKKPGLSETKLPFTVLSDALKTYPEEGDAHGYFHVQLQTSVYEIDTDTFGYSLHYYREGAWLRKVEA